MSPRQPKEEERHRPAHITPGRTVILLAVGLLSCNDATAPSGLTAALPPPPRPASCTSVAPGTPLKPLIEQAHAASPDQPTAFCLEPGVWEGALVISSPIHLWGPPDAILRSQGAGTTLKVTAPGVRLEGFTVDGSGTRYDTQDAAVLVQASHVRVEGLTIRNAVFGILVEKAQGVSLRQNTVVGLDVGAFGMRGDGLRFWEVQHSRMEGNRVQHGRDVVLWYSSHNEIIGNQVTEGRYGTHLMFSHNNLLRDNRYLNNVVGVFIMYSRSIRFEHNLLAGGDGSGGVGLGVKESGNLTVTGNAFLANTTHAYLDTTPLQLEDRNTFTLNTFRLGQVGVSFHSSEQRNTFQDNSFQDNFQHVEVEGGGHARDICWTRNHFDDYAGFDLDGDGQGDLPYELRSVSSDLTSRFPSLAFFRGTPAILLAEAVSHLLPLFQPRTILTDPSPRMDAPAGVPYAD